MAVNLSLLLGAKGGAQTKGEIDGVTGSVKKLDTASAGAGSGGLAKLGNALLSGVKVAATAALSALTALGAGIVSSTMKAADMEQKVADIASVMGLAKEETAPLAALIKDLGIDPKLKVSATEAGVAIENLAKNGLSMTDILDGAARSTVLLANATGADFETAANVATDTMALFKIKADDMKSAVDGITAVTIASKFGIQDYALALAQGGGVASSVGVDFKDFNTTIAAISPFFASGSDAGTSFKVMLQNLIPKSQEAEDLMKQLGLMTADGANAFYDASGNMKSMSDISSLLNTALAGLSEEQKNQALSTLFGTDAMRAAFGLMGAGEVVYTDAAKAASELGVSQELVNAMMEGGITKYEALQLQMSKGDAEKSAATRMDTLRGAIEILSGVFETLQIGIGEKFIPVFRLMVDRISAFLSDNSDDIIAWAGGLADGLQGLITTQLPLIVAKLGEWWNAGKNVITSIREIGTLNTVWQGVTDLVSVASEKLSKWATVLFTQIGASLPGWIEKFKEWGVAAWQWIVDATPVAVAKLVEWGNAVLSWLTSNLPTWLAKLKEWGVAAWKWISDATPSAVTILAEWGRQLLSWLTSNLTTWLAKLKEWGVAMMTWISDAITPALTKMNEWTNQLFNWLTSNLPTWLAKLKEWGVAAWKWISDATPSAVTILAEWGRQLLSWLTSNLPTWLAKLKEWGVAAWDWLAKAIPATVTKLGEWGGSLFRWLGEHLPDLLATLLEWGTALISWIGDAIPGAIAAFSDWLTAVNDWDEKTGAPGLAQMVAKWVGILIEWIASDLIPKVGPAFLDLSSAMLKALGKIVVELGAAALKLGVTIIAAIVEGLADMVGVDLALGDLKKNIIDTIDNWRAAIYGAGAAVTRRIGEGLRSLLSDPQGAIASVIDNARATADSAMATWSAKLKEQGSTAVQRLQEGIASVKESVRTEVAKTLKDIEDYGMAEGLGKLAGRMYEAAKQGLNNFAAGFANQAPTAKQDMVTVLNTVQNAIGGGLDNISKSIADWAGPAATKFYNAAKDLMAKFLEGWSSLQFNVGAWTSGISASLNAWLVNGKDDFKNAGLNLISSFLGGWSTQQFDLGKWLNDGIGGTLRDWLQTNLNSVNQWAGDIGKAIVSGIGAGITGASTTLRDALTYLANLLPQWAKDALGIHSPSTVFRAIGQNIIQGLTQGIEDLAAQPQIALSGAVTGMAPATEAISRQNISTVTNSSVVQNYFTIAERGGGQFDLAERVRLLNMMYG